MLISSPEFTLIELDLVRNGDQIIDGIPRSAITNPSVHPFEGRIKSDQQGVQLLVQNLLRGQGILMLSIVKSQDIYLAVIPIWVKTKIIFIMFRRQGQSALF